MKQRFSKEDIKPIVCSLFISLSAGFFVNILVLLSAILAKDCGWIWMQLLNEAALLISLVVVPYLMYSRVLDHKFKKIDKKEVLTAVLVEAVVLLGLVAFFDKIVVLHYLVIAFAEEVHFRKLQYEFLEDKVGMKKALIVSSVIFAFVLHLNDPILGNLLIRLPLGIILCLIRYKFGLIKSIVAHWVYDVVISMI